MLLRGTRARVHLADLGDSLRGAIGAKSALASDDDIGPIIQASEKKQDRQRRERDQPPEHVGVGNRPGAGQIAESGLAEGAAGAAHHRIERDDRRPMLGRGHLVNVRLLHGPADAHGPRDDQEQAGGQPEGAGDPHTDGRRGLNSRGPEEQRGASPTPAAEPVD